MNVGVKKRYVLRNICIKKYFTTAAILYQGTINGADFSDIRLH